MSKTNKETINERQDVEVGSATQDVVEAGSEQAATESATPQEATPEATADESAAVDATANDADSIEAGETAQAEAVTATEPAAEVEEAAAKAEPSEAPEVAASSQEAPVEEAPAEEAPSEEVAAAPETASESVEAAPAEDAKSAEKAETAAEPAAEAAHEATSESVEAAPAEETKSTEKAKTAAEPAAEAAPEATPSEATPSEATPSEATPSDETQPDETMVMLAKAITDKVTIKGQVIGWNKGGYHVAVEKIAAFCPVSQIEIGNPRSPKRYLDKTFEFRVLEIQKGGRRVVLSRAEALKAEREARAKLVRERLKAGEILEGKITSITAFGAFVDLGGGIEGLVHISELSRRRVEHPKEFVQVGQEVKVTVLKIEKNGQRISLSMKRLEDDPWKAVADRFPPGEKFTGKILRKAEFGMFIELEPGLEGLVHLSRLPLGMNVEDESLEVGKEIEVWVHEVESKRRRLSLSMREVVGGNPWKGIGDRFPEGEIVKGIVERLTTFGVFIELEPGLTGLLPFSALPGISNPKRQYHAGKEVQIRVLSIDTGRKRISLGTEASKAEGSQQDYREYQKSQTKVSSKSGGMNALAAAFAKLKGDDSQQDQQ